MPRWVQDPKTGELVLVEHQGVRAPRAPVVHTDLEPFTSPIDGSVIGSKAALREHNARHDVVQHQELGEGGGQRYLAERERERHDRQTGNTKRDREERLRSIIPIVERNEKR